MKILSLFETTSLIELQNRAPLFERVDLKFVFSRSIFNAVLQDCLGEYEILSNDGNLIFNYTTDYYDTEKLLFYKQHHNGKGNRLKIRTRIYENNKTQFLEIKKKTNKGKTIKTRLESKSIALENKFLMDKTGFEISDLYKTITSKYSRITLIHKQFVEKITLDFDLKFENETNTMPFNNIVIAEIKSEKNSKSCFTNIMKRHHINKGSLSKYCFGVLSLGQVKKYNNFKPMYLKLLHLNKTIIT